MPATVAIKDAGGFPGHAWTLGVPCARPYAGWLNAAPHAFVRLYPHSHRASSLRTRPRCAPRVDGLSCRDRCCQPLPGGRLHWMRRDDKAAGVEGGAVEGNGAESDTEPISCCVSDAAGRGTRSQGSGTGHCALGKKGVGQYLPSEHLAPAIGACCLDCVLGKNIETPVQVRCAAAGYGADAHGPCAC